MSRSDAVAIFCHRTGYFPVLANVSNNVALVPGNVSAAVATASSWAANVAG